MQVVTTIIEIALFFVLLISYFNISKNKKITPLSKWLITISSIGILLFIDRIKLVLWLVAVFVILIVKYKKKKDDELA